jgi:hypothetical protein
MFLAQRPRSPMPASGVTDAARNEQASGMTAGRHSDRIVIPLALVLFDAVNNLHASDDHPKIEILF